MYQIYFDVVKYYQTKLGRQTMVLFQVGKFYEMYTKLYVKSSLDDDDSFQGADPNLSKILQLKMSQKPDKNLYMMGFPIAPNASHLWSSVRRKIILGFGLSFGVQETIRAEMPVAAISAAAPDFNTMLLRCRTGLIMILRFF